MKTKEIPWYPWYYARSDGYIIGKMWKVLSGRLSDRYYKVALPYNKKQKDFLVHRLIALVFIPNPDNKPYVNHIDGNRLNNAVNNLEWNTHAENMQHAYRNNLIPKDHLYKSVWAYSQYTGELIHRFSSVDNGANMFHVTPSAISNALAKRRKTCCWYIWKYL